MVDGGVRVRMDSVDFSLPWNFAPIGLFGIGFRDDSTSFNRQVTHLDDCERILELFGLTEESVRSRKN